MERIIDKRIHTAMDAAAQSETAQKYGMTPELHAQEGNYWRVAFTNMGVSDEANLGLLEICLISGGMLTVQAGYQTESITAGAGLKYGIIRNFFTKCPHATACVDHPHIVVCTWKQLQAVLEWALNEFWNVQVKTSGYAGLEIEEAFLP